MPNDDSRNSQLARFCKIKFTCNSCVCSTMIIFTVTNISFDFYENFWYPIVREGKMNWLSPPIDNNNELSARLLEKKS